MPDHIPSLVAGRAFCLKERTYSKSLISGSTQAFLKRSASILLIKNSSRGLKVLMMKRSHHLAFAPGALVFPGGCVDISDTKKYLWSPSIIEGITRGRQNDIMFRIAALRELWEETGILLTDRLKTVMPEATRYARSLAFRSFLRSKKARLLTNSLIPFSRWITPEGLPKRYDTHFFVAPFTGRGFSRPDGYEAIWAGWLTPSDILQDCQTRGVSLMAPTRLNLLKLSRSKTVAQALKDARQLPRITILPKMIQKKRTIVIPLGSGYDKSDGSYDVKVDRKTRTQTLTFKNSY